jgi:hypothetical protein
MPRAGKINSKTFLSCSLENLDGYSVVAHFFPAPWVIPICMYMWVLKSNEVRLRTSGPPESPIHEPALVSVDSFCSYEKIYLH